MSQPVLARNFPATNAFDLKASYQRNLMTSMSAVTLLAMGVAAAIWIADTYFFEIPQPVGIRIIDVKPWEPFQPISRPPSTPAAPGEASKQPAIGIPETVAEESPIEQTIEVASAGNGTDDSLVCKYLQEATTFAEGTEYFPSDTEFIVVEKPAEVALLCRPEYPRLAQKAGLTGIV